LLMLLLASLPMLLPASQAGSQGPLLPPQPPAAAAAAVTLQWCLMSSSRGLACTGHLWGHMAAAVAAAAAAALAAPTMAAMDTAAAAAMVTPGPGLSSSSSSSPWVGLGLNTQTRQGIVGSGMRGMQGLARVQLQGGLVVGAAAAAAVGFTGIWGHQAAGVLRGMGLQVLLVGRHTVAAVAAVGRQ